MLKCMAAIAALTHAPAAAAAPWAANDVSILLPAPEVPEDPRLPAASLLTPDLTEAAVAAVAAVAAIKRVNALGGPVAAIDTTLLTARQADWHIASIRVDPGAPGLGEAFDAFCRQLQIRLVVQPVVFDGSEPWVRDEALHLV